MSADSTPHKDPNFWQIRFLDRVREWLAVKLAPWAIYDDLRDWYDRGKP